MGFISNAWKNTKLVCGNHGDDYSHEMQITQGQNTVFYSCPLCYGGESNQKCSNRIDIPDYEKMLSKVADEIINADMAGEIADLTGFRWKHKGIIFEVLKHEQDDMVISMLNKKALV